MPQVNPAIETFARIKVVGVGGAGGAAINRMIESGVENVEFVVVNTDAQALHHSLAPVKIHIGQDTTRGLGAGADPTVGEKAAMESMDDIRQALEGADMVFVTLGAGGGTGSGAGHIVAQMAKDSGSLVVGFATKPFAFEGEKRRRNADEAIEKLRSTVDTLITIPNDRLLQTIDRRTPLLEAFKVADDVLRQGVQGISDLITVHGLINLDFADVKAVMAAAGTALMGIGRATGENRAVEASQQAIESPLLEVSIDGARGILFNVIGGMDMTMHEINTAAETITAAADPDANIIFGATINPDLEGEMIVTVVATGFDAAYFANRTRVQPLGLGAVPTGDPVDEPTHSEPPVTVKQEDVADINMDLEKETKASGAEEFHSDTPGPSIWAMQDDNSASDNNHHDDNDEDPAAKDFLSGESDNQEDDLEKPSFLRRLKRRRSHEDGSDAEHSSDHHAS